MNETIFPTQRPEMILFDYGQTLVAERLFSGLEGTKAVMGHAVENRYNYTPEEVQAEAERAYLQDDTIKPEIPSDLEEKNQEILKLYDEYARAANLD